MLKGALLSLSNQRSVYRFVMRHDLLRGMAWRYVAGEDLADAVAIAQALNSQGLGVSLDHLGEHVRTEREAGAAADAYLELVDAIARERIDAYASLKLTQMGLDVRPDVCLANMRRILDRARQVGQPEAVFVRIDMESSAYTARTLEAHETLWKEGYRHLGVVLQSALYRSEADLQRMLRLGVSVRLCKGAYLEPPEAAWPRKADVDASYVRLMERLLVEGQNVALATHDEAIVRYARDFARRERIPASRFEFQMLLGVRRDLQLRLREQGYRVRVYVPYGREWYPYLTRRLAERPANLAFFVRAILAEAAARRARQSPRRNGRGRTLV